MKYKVQVYQVEGKEKLLGFANKDRELQEEITEAAIVPAVV